MPLTRKITPLAALAAILVLAPAAAAHPCSKHAKGGQITHKTKEAHVYIKNDVRYGCASRVGSPRRLPGLDTVSSVREFGDGRTPVHITLSGVFVAYGRYTVYPAGGGADTQTDILVVDLRTGKTVAELRATLDPNQSRSSYVAKIVLKRNGSVAWTNEHHTNSVHRFSTSPGATGRIMLDSGDDIDLDSLTLSADRNSVSWTRGGQTKSAPLP